MTSVYRPDHPQANKNGMVDKRLAGPLIKAEQATYVISDTMDALKHMGTGEMIDSKSRFRQATKASGCEEAGNDAAVWKQRGLPEPSMGEIVNDVKRAMAELNR